jgi:hypothetical protein
VCTMEDFSLGHEIGKGGFGRVVRATHKRMGKVLPSRRSLRIGLKAIASGAASSRSRRWFTFFRPTSSRSTASPCSRRTAS